MDIYALTDQMTLDNISRHCPEALSTYILCLNHVDKDGRAFFSRTDVEINMSQRWTKFRNNIKKLALENLLEWHPFNDGISITMVHDENE